MKFTADLHLVSKLRLHTFILLVLVLIVVVFLLLLLLTLDSPSGLRPPL
jgi:hypothetical protein